MGPHVLISISLPFSSFVILFCLSLSLSFFLFSNVVEHVPPTPFHFDGFSTKPNFITFDVIREKRGGEALIYTVLSITHSELP